MTRHTTESGYTLTQLMLALAIMVILMLISVPAFSNIIAKSRVRATLRTFTGDLQNARGQAVLRGWEYKIFGFGGTSANAQKNQYRMLARINSGTAWPSDTSASFRSTTQWAEPWVNVTTTYPGVTLDPGGTSTQDRFDVAFDARGTATMSTNDFAPFRVLGQKDALQVTISPIGGMTIATGTFP